MEGKAHNERWNERVDRRFESTHSWAAGGSLDAFANGGGIYDQRSCNWLVPPVRVHSARGVCIGEPKESMTLYCDGRKCVYVSVDGEPGRWCMDGERGWNDYVSSVVCTVLT